MGNARGLSDLGAKVASVFPAIGRNGKELVREKGGFNEGHLLFSSARHATMGL